MEKLTNSLISPPLFFFPGKMLKGWKMAGWTPSGSVLLYNLRMVGCTIQVWDGSLVTPMPAKEFGYGLDRKIGYGRKGSSIPTFSIGRTKSGCITFIRMKLKIPLSPTKARNSFPSARENNFRQPLFRDAFQFFPSFVGLEDFVFQILQFLLIPKGVILCLPIVIGLLHGCGNLIPFRFHPFNLLG